MSVMADFLITLFPFQFRISLQNLQMNLKQNWTGNMRQSAWCLTRMKSRFWNQEQTRIVANGITWLCISSSASCKFKILITFHSGHFTMLHQTMVLDPLVSQYSLIRALPKIHWWANLLLLINFQIPNRGQSMH